MPIRMDTGQMLAMMEQDRINGLRLTPAQAKLAYNAGAAERLNGHRV